MPEPLAPQPLLVILFETPLASAESISCELVRAHFAPEVLSLIDAVHLSTALEANPALILCDLKLASTIQAMLRARNCEVPLVVVYEPAQEEQALACLEAGAAEALLVGQLGRLGFSLRRAQQSNESRRIEKALRQSQAQFQEVVQIARLGIWDWNIASDHVDWNAEMLRIYGVKAEDFTGKGEDYIHFTRSDYQETQRQNISKAFLHGITEEGLLQGKLPAFDLKELCIVRPDGSECFTLGEALVIVDAQGQPLRMLGVTYDITAQKMVEAALGESELKYRSLIEQSFEGIVLLDELGRIIEWNHALEQITGISMAEAVGRADWDVLFTLTVPEHQSRQLYERMKNSILNSLQSGQSSNFNRAVEVPIQRRDGSRLLTQQIVFPIQTQQGYRIGAIVRDVTEQKRAEEDRQQAHRQLDAIFHASPLAMIALDRDARVTLWSPAAERMFGWSAAEVTGSPLPYLNFSGGDVIRREIEEVFQGRIRTAYETRRFRRDGSPMDVSLSTAPLHDAHGQVSGMIAILLDISERKRAEAQMRQLTLAVQQSPASILITDVQGQIEYANPKFCELTGYSLAEIARKTPRILKSGDTSAQEYAGLWQTILAGGIWQGEFHNKKKNGELYWEQASISPVVDEHGSITHFLAVKEDITERKRAEAALNDAGQFHKAIFDTISANIAVIDADGVILEVNQAWERFARENGDASGAATGVGINYLEVLRRADFSEREMMLQGFEDIISGRRAEFSLDYSCHSPTLERWFLMKVAPLNFGRGGAVIVHIDITDRVLAELALAQGEQRYRMLFEQSPVAIGIMRQGKLVYANSAYLRMFGYSALDEIQDHFIFEFMAPQTRAQASKRNLTGDEVSDLEVEFDAIGLRKDGTQFPLHGTASRTMMMDGPARIAFFSDMTHQKQSEAENQRLYEQTLRRTEELESLAHLSSTLRQARTLQELIPLLTGETSAVLHAGSAALILFLRDDFAWAATQQLPQLDPFWRKILEVYPPEQVLQNQAAFFYSELEPVQQPAGPPNPFRAFALAHLKSAEALLGVLCVGYSVPHIFREEEKRLLVAIAEMAGNAIQRTLVMETLEQRVQVRTRDLEALYEISALISGSIHLETILERCLDKILEIFHTGSGLIQILAEDWSSLEMAVYHEIDLSWLEKKPIIPVEKSFWNNVILQNRSVIDFNANSVTKGGEKDAKDLPDVFLSTPVGVKGEVFGVISIFRQSIREFSVEEIVLMETFASQIGAAVASDRLRRRSREAAVLEERQRLARDLHDSVTQSLYSLNLLAEGYRKQAAGASASQLDAWFVELGDVAHQSIKDLRLLLYELRPSAIQQDGLTQALRRRLDAVEGRSGIKSRFITEGDLRRLSRVDEEELYHIAQEALNNALKHAFASSVTVQLRASARELILIVEDDGVGFHPGELHTEGMGLNNMQARAQKLNGALEIQSHSGAGTRIKFYREDKNDEDDPNFDRG